MNEHECMHFSLINTNFFNSTPCKSRNHFNLPICMPFPKTPWASKYRSQRRSTTNQVSWRSSALVQLNVKQIKAHPIEMDPLSSWNPLDMIGLFQNVILLPLVDLTWVGTSKVVAMTKPPCWRSSSCPLQCKNVGGSFKLEKRLGNLWISKSMSWSSWINPKLPLIMVPTSNSRASILVQAPFSSNFGKWGGFFSENASWHMVDSIRFQTTTFLDPQTVQCLVPPWPINEHSWGSRRMEIGRIGKEWNHHRSLADLENYKCYKFTSESS